MHLKTALFCLAVLIAISVSNAYEYESDTCTNYREQVDSCTGYETCTQQTSTIEKQCETQYCKEKSYYECNPKTENYACEKNQTIQVPYSCNCECTQYGLEWDLCASKKIACENECVETEQECTANCNWGFKDECKTVSECTQTSQTCTSTCQGGFDSCATTTQECNDVCVQSHYEQKTCKFLWWTWECGKTVCDKTQTQCDDKCNFGWNPCKTTKQECTSTCTKTENKQVCSKVFSTCATTTTTCTDKCTKTNNVCRETNECIGAWVTDSDTCLKTGNCETCLDDSHTENRTVQSTCEKQVYETCEKCNAYAKKYYTCNEQINVYTATLQDCENQEPTLNTKICQGYPCAEQEILQEGEKYYLGFEIGQAYHNGKSDVSANINGVNYHFKSENYEKIAGAHTFTATTDSQFEINVKDNIDGDTVTLSLEPLILTRDEHEALLHNPFNPKEGDFEVAASIEESVSKTPLKKVLDSVFGIGKWGLMIALSLAVLAGMSVSSVGKLFMGNKKTLESLVKGFIKGAGKSAGSDEIVGDAISGFVPIYGDGRDILLVTGKWLKGEEIDGNDKLTFALSIIGLFLDLGMFTIIGAIPNFVASLVKSVFKTLDPATANKLAQNAHKIVPSTIGLVTERIRTGVPIANIITDISSNGPVRARFDAEHYKIADVIYKRNSAYLMPNIDRISLYLRHNDKTIRETMGYGKIGHYISDIGIIGTEKVVKWLKLYDKESIKTITRSMDSPVMLKIADSPIPLIIAKMAIKPKKMTSLAENLKDVYDEVEALRNLLNERGINSVQKIIVKELEEGMGYYDPKQKLIKISLNTLTDKNILYETLIHEGGHYIVANNNFYLHGVRKTMADLEKIIIQINKKLNNNYIEKANGKNIDIVRNQLLDMTTHKNALMSKSVDKKRYVREYEKRITEFTDKLIRAYDKKDIEKFTSLINNDKRLVPILAEQKAMRNYLSPNTSKKVDEIIEHIRKNEELKKTSKDIDTLVYEFKRIFEGIEIK